MHIKHFLDLSLHSLRFCHRSDGRYGFEKYFKGHCVLHSSSNENWFAFSTNTVFATKFPTDFNSTLLCFPTNCSKYCYIDSFFNLCHTFKYTNAYAYVFCWPVKRASKSCFSIKLVMFHKKRDQSSLTVKISTFTFTTSCFVSKRCNFLINYHKCALEYVFWLCGTSWKKLCQCNTVSKSFQKYKEELN